MICAKVSIGLHLPTEPTIREVFRAGVALGLQLPRKRTEQLALLDRFKKFLKSQVRNSAKVPGEQLVREFPERPDSLPEQWKIGYEKEPSAGVMLEAKHMTPEYTISLRSSDKHVQNEKAEVEHPAVTTGVSSMERAMRMMAEMFQGVLNKNADNTGCNLTMTKPRGRRPLMLQDAEEHDTPTSAPAASPRGSPPAPSPPAASPSATAAPAQSPAASPAATAQTAGMRLPTIDVEEDEEDAAEADAAAYRAAKMKRPAAAAKLPGAAGARRSRSLRKESLLQLRQLEGSRSRNCPKRSLLQLRQLEGARTRSCRKESLLQLRQLDGSRSRSSRKESLQQRHMKSLLQLRQLESRWRPGRQRWRRAIPQSSTREARFTGMKKRHVSESLCLKKTNVTKRSRGRHAAKMLLGRKHANFWRTSDCAVVAVEKNVTWQRLNTLWFRLFRTSRVCCVLRCGFCSHLYIYIYICIRSHLQLPS